MFGSEESSKSQNALHHFIRSLTGSSELSFIVQTKDKHNGNIMVDDARKIIHIDFGFIFDWLSGGNMRFEWADFKLTHEMTKILGGRRKSQWYQLFGKRTIQEYLAIRHYSQQIYDLVYFMFHSGYHALKEKVWDF